VPVSPFSSLEGRVALLEDKVETLITLVAKVGLLTPEVTELQRALAEVLRSAAAEAVRTALVETDQAAWNSASERSTAAEAVRTALVETDQAAWNSAHANGPPAVSAQ